MLTDVALADLADIPQITRILTSGHGRTATEGTAELAELVQAAAEIQRSSGPLIICPAAGINAQTAPQLLERIPSLTELHLTASGAVQPDANETLQRGAELGFGSGAEWKMDKDKLQSFHAVVQAWSKRESDEAGKEDA